MTKIEQTNIKAIHHLTIPLEGQGGIVVLRGCQGVGKSTAIKAASALLGGDRDGIEVRDGEERGEIKLTRGNDTVAKISVTRSRVSGGQELAVTSLESRANLGTIVSPGIKDPLRADAARARELLKLCGVEASTKLYEEMCGGTENFRKLDVDTETDCPVELSRRVKKSLVSRAGRHQDTTSALREEILKIEGQLEHLDLDGEQDEEALRQKHQAAIKEHAKIEAAIEAHQAAVQRAEEAKAKLDSKDKPARTSKQIQTVIDSTSEQIAKLESQLEKTKQLKQGLEKERDDAKHWEEMESVIEVPKPEHGPRSLKWAWSQVEEAAAEVEKGKARRESKAMAEKLIELRQRHETYQNASTHLRRLADQVEPTLWRQMPEIPIKLNANRRLVIKTDRSDAELFDDLSAGERITTLVPIACQIIGNQKEGSIMTLPQEDWEGLQPANKQKLADLAKQYRVHIITAEATDSSVIEVEQLDHDPNAVLEQSPPDFSVVDGLVVDDIDVGGF